MAAESVNKIKRSNLREQLSLHTMMLPGILLGFIFSIVPLFGLIMAFQNYDPAKGFFESQFVDIYNFTTLFRKPDFWQTVENTVVIALLKIVFLTIFSIVLALFINEIQLKTLKKSIQTVVFLPYFLSWALLGGLIVEMFSYSGSFNTLMQIFNVDPQSYITSNKYFRTIVVATDVWKTVGYQIVIFLAAITNIDSTLYEAAQIDGAGYTKLCFHITIPGIMPMIVLMSILNIGNIMNAGFEQILILYSDSIKETGDILDTMAYREGLTSPAASFSIGTAVGLFKSVISCLFFTLSFVLANKFSGYTIF